MNAQTDPFQPVGVFPLRVPIYPMWCQLDVTAKRQIRQATTGPDGSEPEVSSRWIIANEDEWRQVVKQLGGESRNELWTIRYERRPLTWALPTKLEELSGTSKTN